MEGRGVGFESVKVNEKHHHPFEMMVFIWGEKRFCTFHLLSNRGFYMFRLMSEDISTCHVDDIFSDVGGEVCDTLKLFGDAHHVDELLRLF